MRFRDYLVSLFPFPFPPTTQTLVPWDNSADCSFFFPYSSYFNNKYGYGAAVCRSSKHDPAGLWARVLGSCLWRLERLCRKRRPPRRRAWWSTSPAKQPWGRFQKKEKKNGSLVDGLGARSLHLFLQQVRPIVDTLLNRRIGWQLSKTMTNIIRPNPCHTPIP